jgi:hypothetical protein
LWLSKYPMYLDIQSLTSGIGVNKMAELRVNS